jgi:hypothetical protein
MFLLLCYAESRRKRIMKILKSHYSLSLLSIIIVFALSANYVVAKGPGEYWKHIKQIKKSNSSLESSAVVEATPDFVNGGFETGDFSGWTFGDNGLDALWPWDVCSGLCGWFGNNNPMEGQYDALNGFDGEAGYEAFLCQNVEVPPFGGTVSLWDRIQYDGWGLPSSLPRIYEVQIRDPQDNILEVPVHVEVLLDGMSYTDLGWQNRSIDVSEYAGQEIRVYMWLLIPETYTGPAQIEFDDFVMIAPEVIPATIRIEPETINLKSKGEFTAFIDLPEGYDEADIIIDSVECEGASALKGMMADDVKLVVKFDKEDLDEIPAGNAVELVVTGELSDGTLFGGSDTVKVIGPGKSAPAKQRRLSSEGKLTTIWGRMKAK